MRLSAHALAADRTLIRTSVSVYYDLVDRIVVSYYEGGLGWTGTLLPIQECLDASRSIDRDGKLDLQHGASGLDAVATRWLGIPLECVCSGRRGLAQLVGPVATCGQTEDPIRESQ